MKRGLALLLVGTMVWLGSVLATVIGGEGTRTASDELWQPWSMQAMQDSLAGGTPVLVDVTADWCVTCKANKALVLERDPVAGALATAEPRAASFCCVPTGRGLMRTSPRF